MDLLVIAFLAACVSTWLLVALFGGTEVKAAVGATAAVERGGFSGLGPDIDKRLGIEPGWSSERERQHIRKKLKEMSSSSLFVLRQDILRRVSALPSDARKDNAWRMLDLVAERLGSAQDTHGVTVAAVERSNPSPTAEVKATAGAKTAAKKRGFSNGAGIGGYPGIKRGWSKEQAKKYLLGEFSKWNSRVSALPSGGERENAQRMLDLIAETRIRYD